MKKYKQLSYEEISLFSRELAMVINSDISIQEGLELIKSQSKEKAIAALCDRIKVNINNGYSLKKAIEQEEEILSPYFISMIDIGADSGNIDIMLNRISESYEKDSKISKKIRSAITYPIILTLLMLSVVVLLIVEVIPLFNDILLSLGGEVNSFTKSIISTGIFLGDNILLILGIIIFIYIVYKIFSKMSSFQNFFDQLRLTLPFRKGIETTYYSVIIAKNLAMLIKSGIALALSFDMIKPVINNNIIKKKLDMASILLKNEQDINLAFEKLDMFPNIYRRMFQVAHRTGHLDEVLDQAADKMEEQLDYRLEKLTTVLEPVLIILISLIVGVILISIIFPVIEIMNSIG
ncbi:MAG: type II secretion system F family protein [Clostridia bacterium]|nr:type II secretion system F family protein [Clostridia bacterium]